VPSGTGRAPHRALVVGAGFAGTKHAEALREIGVDVVGPLSGSACATDTRPIADPAVDVVHVCATNELHVPLAAAALRAGKHVICEKPLALDVAGAEELVRLARIGGLLGVVCQTYRFLPLVAELAGRVAAGDLGAPHLVRGSFLQDWLLLEANTDWRLDPARGGVSRAVADIGIHWLDLAEWIMGQHVEAVVAEIGRLYGRATEDHAAFLVRFAGGLQGACVISQATAGHRNDLELSVDGAEASATWRLARKDELWLGGAVGGETVIARDGDLRSPVARDLAARAGGANEGRRNLIAAAYAALDGDATPVPLATFEDGLRHVRFAAAALESARRGVWVEIA
jgi:predicted dehydrogenase